MGVASLFSSSPWMIGGDLILSPRRQKVDFNSFISSVTLMDIGFPSSKFTLCNNRQGRPSDGLGLTDAFLTKLGLINFPCLVSTIS